MKERPMIFNTEMTKAIAEGRKTVTRRPVNVVDSFFHTEVEGWEKDSAGKWFAWGVEVVADSDGDPTPEQCHASYGCIDFPYKRAFLVDGRAHRVANVRIERLQDISNEDAVKEGIYDIGFSCTHKEEDKCYNNGKTIGFVNDPIACFKDLWNSIYKNWNDNPWVWVIEFEVVT